MLEELFLYEWRLPDDVEPLRRFVRAAVNGDLDAVAFTSQIQVRHLLAVARDLGLQLGSRAGAHRARRGGRGRADLRDGAARARHAAACRAGAPEDGPPGGLAGRLSGSRSLRARERGPGAWRTNLITGSPARGHLPTLVACFLHFDLSFMLWVLLGALGVFVADDLGLSAAQKGFLVALPLLTGSLLRIPVGFASDRLGGKRVALGLLALIGLALTVAWQWADAAGSLAVAALLLGAGGASFAVALPLASRWYPPDRQGLVMGIAAAGNSGTVITNLVAPPLAAFIGWRGVFGAALVPLALVAGAFVAMARESPQRTPAPVAETWRALRDSDLWWFCLFYAVTFGGYVGLSTFLPFSSATNTR